MKKSRKRDFDIDHALGLFDALGIESFRASPWHIGLIHGETGTRYDWYWNKGNLLTFHKDEDGFTVGSRRIGLILDPEDVVKLLNKIEYEKC